jgi:pimeloyl-ACP methyl ester carboxylesterase
MGMAATLAYSAVRLATWGLLGGRVSGAPVIPVGEPRGQRQTVVADDGVLLHAEIEGDPAAPVTVVLCHGFALTSASWCFQRAELATVARVVAWDQRGHGRSGRGQAAHATIDQLGRDLLAVLDQTAGHGPVVLVGHSLGGMAVLALAAQRPDLFGDRIAGVALLSTSAGPVTGDLGPATRGLDLLHRLAPWALTALCRTPGFDRVVPVREMIELAVARHAFGGPVSPAVADFLVDLIESTPLEVLAEFFPQFRFHDKRDALDPLADIPCLVMTGSADTTIPGWHSENLAHNVPGAELVVVPGAGHALPLEQPGAVNAQLCGLVESFGRRRTA